jgi:hypothetical protein
MAGCDGSGLVAPVARLEDLFQSPFTAFLLHHFEHSTLRIQQDWCLHDVVGATNALQIYAS